MARSSQAAKGGRALCAGTITRRPNEGPPQASESAPTEAAQRQLRDGGAGSVECCPKRVHGQFGVELPRKVSCDVVSDRPQRGNDGRHVLTQPLYLSACRAGDLPVLAHGGSARARGLRPRGVGRALAKARPPMCPSASMDSVGTSIDVISRLNFPARVCPCQRFATNLAGRRGSLGLRRGTPAFLPPCRFIPAPHRLMMPKLPGLSPSASSAPTPFPSGGVGASRPWHVASFSLPHAPPPIVPSGDGNRSAARVCAGR
jgi:hypothetical protein